MPNALSECCVVMNVKLLFSVCASQGARVPAGLHMQVSAWLFPSEFWYYREALPRRSGRRSWGECPNQRQQPLQV